MWPPAGGYLVARRWMFSQAVCLSYPTCWVCVPKVLPFVSQRWPTCQDLFSQPFTLMVVAFASAT